MRVHPGLRFASLLILGVAGALIAACASADDPPPEKQGTKPPDDPRREVDVTIEDTGRAAELLAERFQAQLRGREVVVGTEIRKKFGGSLRKIHDARDVLDMVCRANDCALYEWGGVIYLVRPPAPGTPTPVFPPVPKTYSSDDMTIALQTEDADLSFVMSTIAKRANVSIVLDPEVHETVTVSFRKIGWRQLVDILAAKADCEAVEEDGVTHVRRLGAKKMALAVSTIGDPVTREAEGLTIAARWLPPVTTDAEDRAAPITSNTVYLECDVRASLRNRHGFAPGTSVPCLEVSYAIDQVAPGANGGAGQKVAPLTGKLGQSIDRTGLHYGATVEMPPSGRYNVTFHISPPVPAMLARHTDRGSGVPEWWAPFDVAFAWDWKIP